MTWGTGGRHIAPRGSLPWVTGSGSGSRAGRRPMRNRPVAGALRRSSRACAWLGRRDPADVPARCRSPSCRVRGDADARQIPAHRADVSALPRYPRRDSGRHRRRRADHPRVEARRAVAAEDVRRMLGGADETSPSGLRDRASLLLLTRLGLRAREVAALAVNDVDCHNGTVRVADVTEDTGRLARRLGVEIGQERVGDGVVAGVVAACDLDVVPAGRSRSRAPVRAGLAHAPTPAGSARAGSGRVASCRQSRIESLAPVVCMRSAGAASSAGTISWRLRSGAAYPVAAASAEPTHPRSAHAVRAEGLSPPTAMVLLSQPCGRSQWRSGPPAHFGGLVRAVEDRRQRREVAHGPAVVDPLAVDGGRVDGVVRRCSRRRSGETCSISVPNSPLNWGRPLATSSPRLTRRCRRRRADGRLITAVQSH